MSEKMYSACQNIFEYLAAAFNAWLSHFLSVRELLRFEIRNIRTVESYLLDSCFGKVSHVFRASRLPVNSRLNDRK